MSSPKSLDEFAVAMAGAEESYRKLTICEALVRYLNNPDADLTLDDTGTFCLRLIEWMTSPGLKICLKGLEAALLILNLLPLVFKPYVSCCFPGLIDRLGDTKDVVRNKVQEVLLKILDTELMTPQSLLDKLTTHGFCHKNFVARGEAVKCLTALVQQYDSKALHLSAITPTLLKLYCDQSEMVREASLVALVAIYKAVGEKLRNNIKKNYSELIPHQKLNTLFTKFDEERDPENPKFDIPGGILAEAAGGEDEADRAIKQSAMKKSTFKMPGMQRGGAPATAAAGGLDENSFRAAFLDVPVIQVNTFSSRDVYKSIVDTLSNSEEDWEKRVNALKKIRSLLAIEAHKTQEFSEFLSKLDFPFVEALKDLRSQVVREACITIAYLAETLKTRFNYFSEIVFPNLVTLIPNSAKVVASAAALAIKYVVENSHNPRVFALIVNSLNSKSKDIRRYMCDLLNTLLRYWPDTLLEKRHTELRTALQKGIADADPEARLYARKAYCLYKTKFPEKADELFRSLDLTYRRLLSESSLYDSTSSLATPRHNQTPKESLKTQAPAAKKTPCMYNRSSSAIDSHAAQRAYARAQYAAASRLQAGSGASLPRPKKVPESPLLSRTPRSRTRVSAHSQSQPGSRSSSPGPSSSYQAYTPLGKRRASVGRPSGIPTPRSTTSSRETSRETSPSRLNSSLKPRVRPMQMLQYNRETERLLSNLSIDKTKEESDESETSSISSNYATPLRGGSMPDLNWDKEVVMLRGQWNGGKGDIRDAIVKLTKPTWSDRREGLYMLQNYLMKLALNPEELRKVTDIFTKMFLDSQTKIFSLFLDTVQELIVRHRCDLNYWLYSLLTKLFMKLGTDVLPSTEKKMQTILSIIRNTFTYEHQMNEVLRFIADPLQTHNTKVKIAALQYLSLLIVSMTSSHFNSPGRDCTTAALSKLIKWMETREVASIAQECIVGLYNLNSSYINSKMTELSKKDQETLASLVSLKRTDSEVQQTTSPSYSSYVSAFLSQKTKSPPPLERESSEDIQRSLHQTSAEIQSYPFDKLRDRHAASHDSGISQLSPQEREIIDRFSQIQVPGNDNSTTDATANNGDHVIARVIDDVTDITADAYDPNVWLSLVEALKYEHLANKSPKEKMHSIKKLSKLITHSSAETIITHFKMIIKVLVDLLPSLEDQQPFQPSENDLSFFYVVVRVLTDLLEKPGLQPHFADLTDLLIMKIIKVIESTNDRLLLNFAEDCLKTMACILPVGATLRILQTYALTSITTVAYCAIVAMNRLVERRRQEEFSPYLDTTMNTLLEAFKSDTSMIRKAVVFCIVSIHNKFGETTMAPYIDQLSTNRKKLVAFYITRKAQEQGTS